MNASHWALLAILVLVAGCAGTREDDSLYRPAQINKATAGNTLEDDYEDREPIRNARELEQQREHEQDVPVEQRQAEEDDDDGAG
ncbi:MAG TPA: hypothetical protein VFG21_03740 [Xanthomonadaceae bacterium]|nr:hypothetical protein [Xanthomonadaceae bacterium]